MINSIIALVIAAGSIYVLYKIIYYIVYGILTYMER